MAVYFLFVVERKYVHTPFAFLRKSFKSLTPLVARSSVAEWPPGQQFVGEPFVRIRVCV